jgi:hypothetical protein
MRTVLRGLTRGLDLSVLDTGHGEPAGQGAEGSPAASARAAAVISESFGIPSHFSRSSFEARVTLSPAFAHPLYG